MNVFNEHPFKVLFDYGHNAHAVGMMADLARRLDVTGRRIVVLAGPGDRRDEDLVAIAKAVAGRFDHYICRRDDNLRERAADEVPRIQAQALRAAGVPDGAISIIPDEQEAIEAALRMGEAGDLLLIFADALARSWKQITKFKPSGAAPSHSAPDFAPRAAAPPPHAVGNAQGNRGGNGSNGSAPSEQRHPGTALGTEPARRLQPRRTDSRRARHPHGAGERRLNIPPALPFEDSRRLTGANLFFASSRRRARDSAVPLDDALIGCLARAGGTGQPRDLGWPARHARRAPPCRRRLTRHRRTLRSAVSWPPRSTNGRCAPRLIERDPARWAGLEQALMAAALDAAENAPAPPSDAAPGVG